MDGRGGVLSDFASFARPTRPFLAHEVRPILAPVAPGQAEDVVQATPFRAYLVSPFQGRLTAADVGKNRRLPASASLPESAAFSIASRFRTVA